MDGLSYKLLDAIKARDVERVRACVSRGADVNAGCTLDGQPTLHAAVDSLNVEIVECLVAAGADVNVRDRRDETILQRLVYDTLSERKISIVKLLINAGADVDTRRGDLTLLHVAVDNDDVELMQFLICRGADVNAKDCHDHTPLHHAMQRVAAHCCKLGSIELLLAAGADVNAPSDRGSTPLHLLLSATSSVSTYEVSKILTLFSRYNMNFATRDRDGMTLMDIVMSSQDGVYDIEVFQTLVLDCGVNVNSVYTPTDEEFRRDQTILHEACHRENLPLVKFLLKNGANVNALDNNRASPLVYALNRARARLLYTNLYRAPCNTDLDLFEYLLKWEPDLNLITADGSNILSDLVPANAELVSLRRAIVQYLAKQEALGQSINPSVLETLRRMPDDLAYFEKCAEELRDAKHKKLSLSWVTFFNLLADHKSKLVLYAENEDLVKDFNKFDVAGSFPVYGASILRRFSKAVDKEKILKQSAKMLSACLPHGFHPKHVVIQKILSFCKLKDLKKLCEILYYDYKIKYV